MKEEKERKKSGKGKEAVRERKEEERREKELVNERVRERRGKSKQNW